MTTHNLSTDRRNDRELTDRDLAEVVGGKTVSWAHDDEAPLRAPTGRERLLGTYPGAPSPN